MSSLGKPLVLISHVKILAVHYANTLLEHNHNRWRSLSLALLQFNIYTAPVREKQNNWPVNTLVVLPVESQSRREIHMLIGDLKVALSLITEMPFPRWNVDDGSLFSSE